LLAVGVNKFSFKYSNIGATPSLTPGTAVTPGASNAEGSWTEVASAANISQDIYGFLLWVSGGATSTQQKDHLLDIGVDPAGGTSYTAIISNIICGESPAITNAGVLGRFYYFPHRIKSGSSVAVRIQGNNATAGTVQVVMEFYGQPSHPELVRAGQYAETIGTITNSGGVTFTPGDTGTEGAWTSLGTTTRALWWWQLCVQVSSGTISGRTYYLDLAYGDASNKVVIIENLPLAAGGSETIAHPLAINAFCEVPAGAEIFIRGTCDSTAQNLNAVAVGIGG